MTSKFSLRKIDYLLKAKMYEKHGINKQEYIAICKKAWDENTGLGKAIADKLYPMSLDQMSKAAGYHIDYTVEQFLKGIKESLPADSKEFIYCLNTYLFDFNTGQPVKLPPIHYPNYWSDKSINEGAYFLCYFDVLGFTKLVESKTPSEVYAIYETILKKARVNRPYTVQQIDTDDRIKPGEWTIPVMARVPFKYAYYSDTILFWAPGHSYAISGFIAKCIDFFNVALKEGVFLRGVISYGDAILNKSKNIFIGRPIIEASNLEKELQWVGVTFGESIYANNFFKYIDNNLVMSSFPYSMKRVINGKIFHIGINWMERLSNEELNNVLKNLKETREIVPDKVKEYINHTIRYRDYYLACYAITNFMRSRVGLRRDFPVEVSEPIKSIRVDKENMFSVFFVELKSGLTISGFIFVVEPKTYEINPDLEDILPFVQLNFMPEYEKHILSQAEQSSAEELKFILYISISEIVRIYK